MPKHRTHLRCPGFLLVLEGGREGGGEREGEREREGGRERESCVCGKGEGGVCEGGREGDESMVARLPFLYFSLTGILQHLHQLVLRGTACDAVFL